MKVRDRELEFDIFDVENAEKYEAAITKVTAANVKVEGETLANTIRKECEVIFDFFDSIFGEGFHH